MEPPGLCSSNSPVNSPVKSPAKTGLALLNLQGANYVRQVGRNATPLLDSAPPKRTAHRFKRSGVELGNERLLYLTILQKWQSELSVNWPQLGRNYGFSGTEAHFPTGFGKHYSSVRAWKPLLVSPISHADSTRSRWLTQHCDQPQRYSVLRRTSVLNTLQWKSYVLALRRYNVSSPPN